MSSTSGIAQIAYGVTDPARVAGGWAARLDAGPFVVNPHIALIDVVHRGAEGTLDHSSAYGRWGNVMVELIEVHGAEPAGLLDLVRTDRGGLHHAAVFADDLDEAAAARERLGHPEVVRAATSHGVRFAWFDARSELGHLVEVYERHPLLTGFYERLGIVVPEG
jgi:hypothetical protein